MPRNNRPRGHKRDEDENDLNLEVLRSGIRRTEIKRGIEYSVQTHNGQALEEDKTWICPNCHITIGRGTNHVVVWDADRGPTNRRHFHSHCWKTFQGVL